MRRGSIVVATVVVMLFVPATIASAHPLGNFTVNLYSGLRIQPAQVLVHYVVDMAEIPAFQERALIDTNGNGIVEPSERVAYAGRTCDRIADRIALLVDGRPEGLRVSSPAMSFPPGAAGLSTLRLECGFAAVVAGKPRPHVLEYRDANFAGHIGWHEITAVGDRARLTQSSVPTTSISNELTRYPQDLLRSPLDVRNTTIQFRAGGAAAPAAEAGTPTLLPRGIDGVTRAFTSFLSRRTFSVPLGIIALLIAIGLGAIHALSPGHGKTVIAAYAIGQRGARKQTLMIGAILTATHTAGVVVLGVLLSLSRTVASERLYPFLGLASGALLVIIGAGLLTRATKRRHSHSHDHPVAPVGMRAIAGMGIAGGLVPSPSALVVLLGAIALGRAWFGVVLVVAYGLGMAVTLCGAGLLLSKARAFAETRSRRGSFMRRLGRVLPVATSTIIVIVGMTIAARGLSQI